jgi:predicted DNA-binding transcriptional regulator YafY
MKYGPEVEIVEPKDLRKKLQETLIQTLRNYE